MGDEYYVPNGGLPQQSDLVTDRAVFTQAYAVIPKGVLRDIVVSFLPKWDKMRFWVLSRPLSGFAETFSQYIVELSPGGGSNDPENDALAEAVLFVVQGSIEVTIEGHLYEMQKGGYAFIPPGCDWSIKNNTTSKAVFHWIRKLYQQEEGIDIPQAFITNEEDLEPIEMPNCKKGQWTTTRFVDIDDMRHDMHVNIVTFAPGAVIPFAETHVMEHGLYVLQGKGVYRLNQDWVEVEAGDYMWLRAFCPQACYAGGPELFKYLLYKDVNRHARLSLK